MEIIAILLSSMVPKRYIKPKLIELIIFIHFCFFYDIIILKTLKLEKDYTTETKLVSFNYSHVFL